jgi:ABC-2 type transport system permease protein
MRKDLALLLREPHALVFALGFPLVFGVFFGAVFADASSDRVSVRCAVVDEDGSDRSAELVEQLSLADGLSVELTGTRGRAAQLTATGRVPAALIIESGYAVSLDEANTGPPAILLMTDPSQPGAASMARGIASGVAARHRARAIASNFAGGVFAGAIDRATSGEVLRIEPIEPTGRPLNAYELTFSQAMVWAIMGCAAAFSVSLVRERAAGTMTRLRLAPGGLRAALLGKALACTAVSIAAASIFAGLGVLAFGVRPESPAMLACAVVLAAAAFAGVMMLVAVLARDHHSPGQVAWGLLLLFALTGGGMLPLAFMPPWLEAVSHASPVRWAILAIEAGVWRGFTWSQAAQPMAVLALVGVVSLAIGLFGFTRDRAAA